MTYELSAEEQDALHRAHRASVKIVGRIVRTPPMTTDKQLLPTEANRDLISAIMVAAIASGMQRNLRPSQIVSEILADKDFLASMKAARPSLGEDVADRIAAIITFNRDRSSIEIARLILAMQSNG